MVIMKYRLYFIMGAIIAIHFFLLLPIHPFKNINSANASQLTLFQGLMCEEIFSNAPRNPTIVFSVAREKQFALPPLMR